MQAARGDLLKNVIKTKQVTGEDSKGGGSLRRKAAQEAGNGDHTYISLAHLARGRSLGNFHSVYDFVLDSNDFVIPEKNSLLNFNQLRVGLSSAIYKLTFQ